MAKASDQLVVKEQVGLVNSTLYLMLQHKRQIPNCLHTFVWITIIIMHCFLSFHRSAHTRSAKKGYNLTIRSATSEELSRLDVTTKQDLGNLCSKYKINVGEHLDEDDMKSTELWTQKLGSSVLLEKQDKDVF